MIVPRLSVVIPARNAPELLEAHLPFVLEQARATDAEVLVVDDASEDERVGRLVTALGAPARLLRLSEHAGFAVACNTGAAESRADALVMLNSDVRPEPGCFALLLSVLESRPQCFAVTPVVANLEHRFPESTTALRWRHGVFDLRFPGREGDPPPADGETREIAFACGAALACRRTEFLALGGFARLYRPFYWEDVDLGWRAWRAGRTVLEAGGARALHAHARTIGRLPAPSVRAAFECNRLIFTWLHAAGAGAAAAHLAWLPLRLLRAGLRRDGSLRGMARAFARAATVRSERRRLRPSIARAASLLGGVRASGSHGWPPAGSHAAVRRAVPSEMC